MTKVFFVLFVVLLGLELAAPSAFAKRGLSNGQVNRRAYRIVQQLKRRPTSSSSRDVPYGLGSEAQI